MLSLPDCCSSTTTLNCSFEAGFSLLGTPPSSSVPLDLESVLQGVRVLEVPIDSGSVVGSLWLELADDRRDRGARRRRRLPEDLQENFHFGGLSMLGNHQVWLLTQFISVFCL